MINYTRNNVDYKENYLSYKNLQRMIKYLEKNKFKYILDQTFNKYETFLFIFKN